MFISYWDLTLEEIKLIESTLKSDPYNRYSHLISMHAETGIKQNGAIVETIGQTTVGSKF